MTDRLEYLAHCPDRETFVAVMTSLQNPLTGAPLATLVLRPTTGELVLVPSLGVRIDEIGVIVKYASDPITGLRMLDENGEPIVSKIVPGHHVNLWAVGALADMLNANGGWTAIFPLLGEMAEMPPSEDGVPQGWQGSSGMRIYPRDAVNHPARVWA